jgi:hypothetical protein
VESAAGSLFAAFAFAAFAAEIADRTVRGVRV